MHMVQTSKQSRPAIRFPSSCLTAQIIKVEHALHWQLLPVVKYRLRGRSKQLAKHGVVERISEQIWS